jgi:uncharacterized protein (TIGR02466 family)
MHKVFETSIYQSRIKFDLKDLLSECHAIQKADKSGQAWSAENYADGYTSYGSWDQLHRLSSTFENLEKQLAQHVFKFAKQLGYDVKKNELSINSLWLNIMPKGAQHTAHIHPNSVISGTFYVDTTDKSSSIKFEDPRMGFFMNAPKLQPKKQLSRFHIIQPKSGDVVLFESWLRHEVPRNQTNKPRVSISFNYS